MFPGYEDIEDEELKEFAEAANDECFPGFVNGVLHITKHRVLPEIEIHRQNENWLIKYDDIHENKTVPIGNLKYPGSLI